MKIITIHGINTSTADFDRDLQKNISTPVITTFWGKTIHTEVEKWKNNLPKEQGWNPITGYRRRVVRQAHASARWVKLYNHSFYRVPIVKQVSQVILDNAEEELILVGHSLGTLVLVDALHNIIKLGSRPKIRHIITMGSPLGYWTPNGEIREILDNLKINWVNFYDSDDIVSGDYGLSFLDSRITDVNINTGGLIRSHVSWWQNKKVAKYIQSLLE